MIFIIGFLIFVCLAVVGAACIVGEIRAKRRNEKIPPLTINGRPLSPSEELLAVHAMRRRY